jgi:hypothetical protein
MRRPYDEDDDEEPWDADIDPEEMITNPSSTEIDMSLLEAQEDEFGDNEEEPSLDDFEDDTEPSESSEDEFGDNEEEFPEESVTPAEDLDIPAVRTASLGRLRGKIPLPAPEEKPAEPEEDEFGDFEEEEPEESAEPAPAAVPPARKRQAAARPQAPEAENAAAEASKPTSDEPMYDNTGLGGFANALVGLFTRRRK